MRWIITSAILLGIVVWYVCYHGTPVVSWHTRYEQRFLDAFEEFMALGQEYQKLEKGIEDFLARGMGPPPRVGDPPRSMDGGTIFEDIQRNFASPETSAFLTAMNDYQRRLDAFRALVRTIPPYPSEHPLPKPMGPWTTFGDLLREMQAY